MPPVPEHLPAQQDIHSHAALWQEYQELRQEQLTVLCGDCAVPLHGAKLPIESVKCCTALLQ
jgi:hypothetical protein